MGEAFAEIKNIPGQIDCWTGTRLINESNLIKPVFRGVTDVLSTLQEAGLES